MDRREFIKNSALGLLGTTLLGGCSKEEFFADRNYINDNMTVVIRSMEERSEEKCIEYAEKIFGKENIFLVKNVTPYWRTIQEGYKIGIREGKKWTLTLDADTFFIKSKFINFMKKVEKFLLQDKDAFCFYVYSQYKFTFNVVSGGSNLYQTRFLNQALDYTEKIKKDLRPDEEIIKKMTSLGCRTYENKYQIGIHDFFQYYEDIVQKILVHTYRHPERIQKQLPMYEKLQNQDRDFYYAIKGFEIYEALDGKPIEYNTTYLRNLIKQYGIKFELQGQLMNSEINATLKKYYNEYKSYKVKPFKSSC